MAPDGRVPNTNPIRTARSRPLRSTSPFRLRPSMAVLALALAAVGIAGARAVLRSVRHPEALDARVDEAGGWRIRSLVGGPAAGPLVVMVHGLGVSGSYMVPTARLLVEDLRVHIPDLPGHGLSEGPPAGLDIRRQAAVLSQWLRRLGLRQAIMVGNSMGCQTIVELAAQDPDRVAALVLVGPTSDAQARTMLRHVGRLLSVAPFERLSLHVLLAVDYLRLGPRRMLTEVRSMLEYPIERTLARVKVPTLVVRGDRDLIVPSQWATRLAAIAGTPLVTVRRAGHAVNYSAPVELARVVRGFAAALQRADIGSREGDTEPAPPDVALR